MDKIFKKLRDYRTDKINEFYLSRNDSDLKINQLEDGNMRLLKEKKSYIKI